MSKLKFVIQKHQATQLHYDFRLEVDGIMSSWAIPKGPTLNPKEKRLAMKVDDHDIKYNNFEGIIPDGSYGAGKVMIWDEGEYLPEVEISKGVREQVKDHGEKIIEEGLEKGELKFFLKGQKIKGSFALIKTKSASWRIGPKNSWLLIKHQDAHCQADFDIQNLDFSVKTGRSLEEID